MAVPSDFVVEVRDVNLVRQGQIDQVYLDLLYTETFRSIGAWQLKLPAEHPLLPVLKAKGSGIVITRKGSTRPYSGRMQSCLLSQDAADPAGTWIITGVDDNVIAAASCTYPAPSLPANAQTADYWTNTGTGESVMKQVVYQNIGGGAPAARRYTWLSTRNNEGRGLNVSATTRFDNMADVLTALGTRANLGWRFFQVGTGIQFDVFVPADKTGLIRLDIRNGGIDSTELGYSAPTASQALVLGQGEGAARTVRPVTSTASLAEAAAWGLRWEVVKDQRNTDDPVELEQAGQEILTEQGSTINSLKIVPSDAPNQKLGIDWDLGDLVTVVMEGQPTTATVTSVSRSVTSAGVITQATVGDPVGFDWEAQIGQTQADQGSRLGALEAQVSTLTAGSTNLPGMLQMTATPAAPAGWLLCQGQAISRTNYPRLFAAIGTAYGAGDGSTTFNVPNLQARFPVGLAASDTDFDALGKAGGAKTVTLTEAQIPSHSHALGSSTVLATNGTSGSTGTTDNGGNSVLQGSTGGRFTHPVSLGGSVGNTGGGGSHPNVPPFVTVNYIIKT